MALLTVTAQLQRLGFQTPTDPAGRGIPEGAMLDATSTIALEQRLTEIAKLEDGWMDGEGIAIPGAVLEQVQRTVLYLMNVGMPRPRIFPIEDGGIEAEWLHSPVAMKVSFMPDALPHGLIMNVDTGATEERDLPAAADVANFISRSI